jgi:uncharacterized membrane protein
MGIGSLLLIVMGIALVYAGGFSWNSAWLSVVFILTILLAINGPVTNGKRSEAIYSLAAGAGEGPVTPEIHAARSDRLLNYSVFLSACELVAALYIMTAKPDFGPCIAAIALAAAVAVIPTASLLRRSEQAATAKA